MRGAPRRYWKSPTLVARASQVLDRSAQRLPRPLGSELLPGALELRAQRRGLPEPRLCELLQGKRRRRRGRESLRSIEIAADHVRENDRIVERAEHVLDARH